MEKIKITKEQEDAYELLLKNSNYDAYRVLSDFSTIEDRQFVCNEYKPLLSLTTEELSLILNRWYEVEQPFKVGDWVYDKSNDAYGQITHVDKDSYSIKGSIFSIYINYAKECFEKVTEPWKIMLLELGRDKPELKKGDIYVTDDDLRIAITFDKERIPTSFLNGKLKYFYPVESRIEVKQ